MKTRTLFQIVSIGLLLYLAADSFMQIEFAVTKNNHFTAFQKADVDSTHNIDTVKQTAKVHLDTIRRIHRNHSNKATLNFWLLTGLVFIQTALFLIKQPKGETKNNSS